MELEVLDELMTVLSLVLRIKLVESCAQIYYSQLENSLTMQGCLLFTSRLCPAMFGFVAFNQRPPVISSQQAHFCFPADLCPLLLFHY